jgi:hypothetical protein
MEDLLAVSKPCVSQQSAGRLAQASLLGRARSHHSWQYGSSRISPSSLPSNVAVVSIQAWRFCQDTFSFRRQRSGSEVLVPRRFG